MSLVVILLFVAMVLAPCVVALWGRLREGADEDEALAEAAPAAAEKHDAPGGFSAMFAAEGPIARRVRKVGRALASPIPPGTNAAEPLPQMHEAAPLAPEARDENRLLAQHQLEDLLRQAVEGARVARAASLRADAAASGAAARIATVRAEAAAEEARRAQYDAEAAERAALSAQAAFEAARAQAQEAAESRQTIRLVSERRAA